MKYFNIIIVMLLGIIFSYQESEKINYQFVLDTDKISFVPKIEQKEEVFDRDEQKVLETFYGTVTAYEPNCYGCIGITAAGYDVRNTITYYDNSYGEVRIIAADKSIPFGSIIKLSNLNDYDSILAIVLDRGGAIGFDTNAQADLLFPDEISSYNFGRQYDVKFEILRLGF